MAKARRKATKGQQTQDKRGKWSLLIVTGAVLILLAAAYFVFQKNAVPYQSEVTGGPSLKVDQEKVDLGDMRLGSTAKVSFTLTNIGDRPLRLSQAPFVEVLDGC